MAKSETAIWADEFQAIALSPPESGGRCLLKPICSFNAEQDLPQHIVEAIQRHADLVGREVQWELRLKGRASPSPSNIATNGPAPSPWEWA